MKNLFELLKKGDFRGIFFEKTEDPFLQFFRYLFVGGASFVADSALLHVLTECGLHYLLSGAMSFIFGVLVNYLLSKWLVFSEKTSGAGRRKEITVFFLVALAGLCWTELFMWLFTEKLGLHYMLSKAVAAILVLFWNFFMKKLLLYRKK